MGHLQLGIALHFHPLRPKLLSRYLHSSSACWQKVTRLKPLVQRPPSADHQKEEQLKTQKPAVNQISTEEIDLLTRDRGHPEDWTLIYRLGAMPFAQAFSKLKLLLTFTLVAGTPLSVAAHYAQLVDANFCWFLLGAASFSLCTLCAFSYFSTQVIGVMSLHKPTGMLRLGLLTFWGSRRNLLVQPNQVLLPADLSDTRRKTVRIGLIGDAAHPEYTAVKPFYLSSVTGRVGDRELFKKHVGHFWFHLS